MKGKDLILTDFLSWIKSDDSDPSEVLPISFVDMQMTEPLPDYALQIRTRSGAKREGTTVPPVHGIKKDLDPHKKPEHQSPQPMAFQPPTPAGPNPPHSTVRKPSPAVTVSRKLIGHSIKTLNKYKQPHKVANSQPPKMPLPPPMAPLIPQFYPLNLNTPMPTFQPEQARLPTLLMPILITSPPAGLLPMPTPSQHTRLIPADDSHPYPASHGTPTRKTFYAPAHMPADPHAMFHKEHLLIWL